jgi:hypothetical protein
VGPIGDEQRRAGMAEVVLKPMSAQS